MTATSIVLLPGLDGTGTLFRPFVAHLPPSLRPIVVSYPATEQLRYSELLERATRALPSGEPFVILGESFSGPLAIMAAATCPAGLQAVVLCATFVRNPLWIPASLLRHLVRPWAFRLYPKFSAAKALLGGYSSAELRESLAAAIGAVKPEVFATRIREVLAVDVSDQLLQCPVPILYLRGTRDLVVPKHNSSEIAAASRVVTVRSIDAPHMVLQTRPVEAAAAILEFLQNHVPAN